MKARVVAHDCMSLNNSERCRATEGLGDRPNGTFAVRTEVTRYPLRGAKPFHSLGELSHFTALAVAQETMRLFASHTPLSSSLSSQFSSCDKHLTYMGHEKNRLDKA